jgi:hypothetical protein
MLNHLHVLKWKIRTLENLNVVNTHIEALVKVMDVIDKISLGEAAEDDFIRAYNQYRHDISAGGF